MRSRGRAVAQRGASARPATCRIGEPADEAMERVAAKNGKAVVSAWIGGGLGLRDYRDADMLPVRNAVVNALRHLGMLGGAL